MGAQKTFTTFKVVIRHKRTASHAARGPLPFIPFTLLNFVTLLRRRRRNIFFEKVTSFFEMRVVLSTVHLWRRRGLLRAHPINDRGDYLYEIPPEDLPAKYAHKSEYQVDPVTSSPNTLRGAV